MWRRVLAVVTKTLKDIKMTEVRASSPTVDLTPPENTGEKRPLEDEEESAAKKTKTETAVLPMQGRADRKRKVALLIAYCGAGYFGIQLQKNQGFKTIEGELIKALLAAELIREEHAETPQKMSFQRAARTDKNVSAAGNVISLKMIVEENVLDKINSHLPPEIRAIAYIRTTRGFDSKNQCTARTYKYQLPTYSFAPFEKFVTKDYRVEEGTIQRVNELLAKYKGTHNFHNFTSGRKSNDPSTKRYIISFECGEPFVHEGMEFVMLTVKGQSFMLHHIRKMIGLMISIVRGYCGPETLEKSWGAEKIDIPKAPGVGLFLDQLFYDGYNKKFGNDGIHEPIVWDKYKDTLEKFKEECILSHIVKAEKEQGVMLQWLGTLQYHKFDVIDPEMGAPPEGEKDQNWWRTRLLLRKIDRTKQQGDGAAASQPDSTGLTEKEAKSGDDTTITKSSAADLTTDTQASDIVQHSASSQADEKSSESVTEQQVSQKN